MEDSKSLHCSLLSWGILPSSPPRPEEVPTMGGGWWKPSDKAVFIPTSLEGLILEERDDTRLLETASGVQPHHLFAEGLFCAFELAARGTKAKSGEMGRRQ